ncbi:ribonuclease E/G [Aestuariivirga litoralis]|uniref:Ribonuclease E n=1 Tax=Aestuariivirga litoralis TaxID=2650924 RepID=A0A2W2BJY3_9HYPH|nr:Rne/Rng family ribonuclease [Aestuariivirga litoralis]PZF76207.1 ribonuclease E/G [Aestuariivirga litoralis]
MGSKMLIDASHPEETRVVVLKGNRIEEFDFESAARKQLKGNIYLAKVTRVEPSLQAAFIEYGGNRHGFLAFSEIHPDYYQIPLADRLALLAAEEEEHAREAEDEDDEGEGNGRRRGRGRDRDRGRERGRGGRRGEENTEGGVEEISEPEYAEDAEAAGDDSFAEDHAPETNEEESPESHVLDMSESEVIEGEAVEYHDESDDDGDDTPPRAEPMSTNHEDPSVSEPVEAGAESAEAEAQIEARLAEPMADAPSEAEIEAAAPAPSIQHGMPGELGNGIEEVGEDPEAVRVEEIGAEDALEEVPQRRRKVQRKQYKIQEVIKRRQVILVQVVKEERGNKGAALTTYLSLAGRYCVLMPNTARGGGISRKITDSGDRRRLKEMVKEIEVPQGMGLIVRTAGAQRTKTEIKRDYDYLLRLWESVRDLTLKSQAPALVYEEGSLVKRAIRDLYTKDVDEVIVEGDEAYREVKDFMKMLMPSHAKNVKPYKDSRPLFSRYQAESQLDALYSPTVTLPSGGYMVINQTEALVSVDINSGKATREHNIEDTAYKTNLEAADEIARQLRLRDLAGLVVIDFIDMEEKRNNRNVERRLKDALKNDRARIQVGHISHFGLLEMSRQRLRPGLLEGSSRTCPHCEGRGVVRSISSCGLSVLRAIEEHLIARKPENLTVRCTREIAFYILNEKRDNLLTIETTYGISVFVTPSDDLKGSQALIERAPERNIPPRKVMAAPVRIDSAFEEEDEEVEAEETEGEAEDENGADESNEASGEERQNGNGEREGGDREGGRRRRRRRGRRGGRGRDEQPSQNAQGGDVPGLGEQPDFDSDEEGEADESLSEAGDESAVARVGGEEPSEDGERPRRGRGRRDRWGRNRDRDRGDRPRGDDRPPREAPSEIAADAAAEADDAPASEPAPAAVETRAPASEPVAAAQPVAEAPAEPVRRWQPPAPTVTPAAVERKSGWWSKR